MILHDNSAYYSNKRASMIRYRSQNHLPLADYEWPFQVALDAQNRWVKLSQRIPWDELAEGSYRSFSTGLNSSIDSAHCHPCLDSDQSR